MVGLSPVEIFAGFTDAEVVLVALTLESGFQFRARDPMNAETAVVLQQVFAYAVGEELRRRELDPMRLATALMGRVISRLPEEV